MADLVLRLAALQPVQGAVNSRAGIYVALGTAIAAFALALIFLLGISRVKIVDEKIMLLSATIRRGASAFLRKEYRVIVVFVAALFLVFLFVPAMGWRVALSFACGAAFSLLAGFIGMRSATKSNACTVQEAKTDARGALQAAFRGGAVMGLSVVALGLGGAAACWLIFKNTAILTGFSLGASSVALFARVGGGIYTKAADVGADLVGKVENGIPEDDPRNPAVIADNVGDNVGDVAGMGADLFESYVGSMVSAVILGIVTNEHEWAVNFIFALCAIGLIASIIGILLVRMVKKGEPQRIMMGSTYASMGIFLIGVLLLDRFMLSSWIHVIAVITGVAAGIVTGISTEWYTSGSYRSVKSIARQSRTGTAPNILEGLSAGMRSTVIPIIMIVIAVMVSFLVCGIYGVALSALGMLATVASVIAVDAYGPIADNAGGIAQMAALPHEVREVTDKLDSVGNTTAAIGKGFSIGSAALTALALLSSFAASIDLKVVNLLDAKVIGGFLFGGMLTYLFSALTIDAVSKSASRIVDEVRRQFREILGLREGNAEPDYTTCISIATDAALKHMVLPGLLAVTAPLLIGFLLGGEALAGMLIGATVCGVLLAMFMSNSGGAWDNAKKLIEEDDTDPEVHDKNAVNYHTAAAKQLRRTHKAAVVGDTVGDPLKDTAGPSMNILIKLMCVVALLFATLFTNPLIP